MSFIVRFMRIHCRTYGGGIVIAGLVFGLQAFDLRLRIAASLLQIFRSVVQLVLIEIGLGLGDVDLILQVIFLRLRRRSQLARQQRDIFLIVPQRLLGFGLACGNLFRFRRKWRRVLFRGPQGIEERQIDLVVANFFRLMRQTLLFRRARLRSHLPRGLQRTLIDQGTRRRCGLMSRFLGRTGFCLIPRCRQIARAKQSHDGHSHQQEQHDRGYPLANFHDGLLSWKTL